MTHRKHARLHDKKTRAQFLRDGPNEDICHPSRECGCLTDVNTKTACNLTQHSPVGNDDRSLFSWLTLPIPSAVIDPQHENSANETAWLARIVAMILDPTLMGKVGIQLS